MLTNRFGRSKLQRRLPPRLIVRHAGAKILFGLQRKMFGDLFAETLVSSPHGRGIRQAYEKASQESHVRSSALILKKRAMIAAVCSQSRVSVCNCLRPAAVRR